MAKPNAKRAKQTQELFADAVEQLGGETPEVPGVPQNAIEKANAVRGRRVLPMRRDDMELWELDPRKSRTRKQIEDMAKTLRVAQDIPIIARYHPDPEKRERGIVQILAGGTRWEAAAPDLADRNILDVDLRDIPDDREALKLAWRTNTQHNDHTAIDNALYFSRLLQMEGLENPEEEPADYEAIKKRDATMAKVGAENGVSAGRIAQYVGLMKLPPEILVAFAPPEEKPIDEEGNPTEQPLALNEKHGRALLQLREYPDEQHRLFLEIKRDKLSGNVAIIRAGKLLEDAQRDAGIEPKPKKTRKPRDSKAGSKPTPKAEPSKEEPAEETPTAEDDQVVEGEIPKPDVTSDAIDETTDEEEQGSAATSSRSLTLGPGTPPSTTQQQSSGGTEPTSIEKIFQPVVDNVADLSVALEQRELTADEARRLGFLAGRLRSLTNKITTKVDLAMGVATTK